MVIILEPLLAVCHCWNTMRTARGGQRGPALSRSFVCVCRTGSSISQPHTVERQDFSTTFFPILGSNPGKKFFHEQRIPESHFACILTLFWPSVSSLPAPMQLPASPARGHTPPPSANKAVRSPLARTSVGRGGGVVRW